MDFRGDERGQPVVIGALLVFVILVLAFSGYQAVVVPQQNADVEFTHFQQVEDDVVDLRVGIVRAAISGGDASTSVRLGTQYPTRLIALNPPPPAGTLRTTEAEEIVINGSQENDIGICPPPSTTRAFVYQPDYNEFQGGADFVYENTFAYSQHRNDETRELVKTNQRVIDADDGVIELIALEGEFSETGTSRVGVDLVRGETNTQEVNRPEITLPTRVVNQETWEEDILDGQAANIDFRPGESITFQLDGRWEVRCTPVGVNKAPASGSSNLLRSGSDGGGGGSGGGTAQSESVQVTSAGASGQGNPKSNVTFTLENTGSSDVTIEQISFDSSTANVDSVYLDSGNELEQSTGNGRLDSRLSKGAGPTELDVYADIPGNDNDDFTIGQFVDGNDNPVDMKNEETTITLVFSDGSSGQYTLST